MTKKILIILVAIGTVILGFFLFLMNNLKGSPAYDISKTHALESKRVVEEFGEIEEFGWFVLGELRTKSDGTGKAKLRYPAYNENGDKVMLNFDLSRNAGNWTVDALYLDR
jgi:uncharacterized protein YxeA